MKRLLVLCAVLVPLSLFVAGCGDKGASSGSKGMVSKEEQEKMMKAQMQKPGGLQGAPAASRK